MDGRDKDILDGPLRALQDWSKTWPTWADAAATRVQAFDPDELSNQQVIGIAVGAAAIIGGALVAIGPGEAEIAAPRLAGTTRTRVNARRAGGKRRRDRRKPTELDGISLSERAALTLAPLAEGFAETAGIAAAQVEQGRQAVKAQAAELAERGEKLTRGTRKELRKQAKDLEGQIRQLQKQLAKQSKRAGRNIPSTDDVRGAASSLGDTISKRASRTLPSADDVRGVAASLGDTVGKRASAAGEATSSAISPLLERARNSELTGQVRSLADSTRGRALAAGAATAAAAAPLIERARQAELPDQVRGLADTTRDRAADLTDRVRDEVLPLVADRVSRVREDVLPQVAEAASRIGTRFKEAGEGSVSDLSGVRKAAVAALTAPPPKQRSAVGTSIWALIFAAVIGFLVYYLQDDDRRQKFIATAQSVAEQGREIVRDFQGYDEEF